MANSQPHQGNLPQANIPNAQQIPIQNTPTTNAPVEQSNEELEGSTPITGKGLMDAAWVQIEDAGIAIVSELKVLVKYSNKNILVGMEH